MSENENGDCSAQMFGDYSALDPVFVDGIAGVFKLGKLQCDVLPLALAVNPKFVGGTSQVIAFQSCRPSVCRISGVGRIMYSDTVFLVLLIEVGGQAIAIGD